MKKNLINKTALTITFFVTTLISCKKETGFLPDDQPSSATEQTSSISLDKGPAAIPPSITPSADWRQVKKSPIAFKPFEMIDKNGAPIAPDRPVTLRSGKQITAKAYFDRLNTFEQKLNAQGFTLRNNEPVIASETVTESEYLDGMISKQPQPIGDLRSDEYLSKFMNPVKKVGDVSLKPLDDYSAEEQRKLQRYTFQAAGDNVTATPIAAASIPTTVAIPNPVVLKKINESDVKEWSFGKASTFKVSARAELIRQATIYQFDPKNPGKSMSEFRVTGKGNLSGYAFGHSVNILNGETEFFAPADSARKMTAKVKIDIGGITLLNLSKSYAQKTRLSDDKYWSLNKSFGIQVPIALGIDFTGKIGIKGKAGLIYSATLGRGFVSPEVIAYGNLSGYAEAGAEFLDLIGGGAGTSLVLFNGKLDLFASLFLANQNVNQIVVGYSYYFGYDITMLKGRVYCYTEVCVPFTDWCWRPIEHTLFSWGGYTKKGTIAEGSKLYIIANL